MAEPISICGDKAATLLKLTGRLCSARIPSCSLLSLQDWRADRELAIARVLSDIQADVLVVRSARHCEDSNPGNAGRYLSLLGVAANPAALADAISRVFDSYGPLFLHDHVLVQPQIKGITHAIVASTRGAFGSAYDSVSCAEGDAPDAITRGDSPADTWHLGPDFDPGNLPGPVMKALQLLDELRLIFDATPFEVELLEANETLWLLQVRPLPESPAIADIAKALRRASTQLDEAREEGVAVLGLMPDWNPAELLGAHPRPLALSLFKSVIGENTWWRARAELGYSRPYTGQLIRSVAGRPYVDVRASFESLCPAELSLPDRVRLSCAWLDRLRANPQLHDCVEFNVVLSGFEFDAKTKNADVNYAVADSILLPALRRLTTKALDNAELHRALEHFASCLAAPLSARGSLQDRIRLLRRNVAQPFARVARCDFLAQALWQSAARRGAIAPQRCLEVLSTTDDQNWHRGIATGNEARPGQFDIRSVERNCANERLLMPQPRWSHSLDRDESKNIAELLLESSLPWNPEELLQISRLAARARELGKRTLAALLGDWLAQVRDFAESRHIDAEILSWLPWDIATDPAIDLASAIERSMLEKQQHADDACLRMPMLLEHAHDLRAVHLPASSGHFHGQGIVEGRVILLDESSIPEMLPLHSVVAIRSADPGYEWIFQRQPAALITAYGGPHSHMALRCADAGCGAVLGLGEERFRKLVCASMLRIDFGQAQIQNTSGLEQTPIKQVA